MMQITKVVAEDVEDKIDIQYIETQLSGVPNVAIAYICTRGGGEEDEWFDEESGTRYIVIHLPYQLVKLSADVRPLMLAKAKERLGLASGSSLN